jgi:hypothetical protein
VDAGAHRNGAYPSTPAAAGRAQDCGDRYESGRGSGMKITYAAQRARQYDAETFAAALLSLSGTELVRRARPPIQCGGAGSSMFGRFSISSKRTKLIWFLGGSRSGRGVPSRFSAKDMLLTLLGRQEA